MLSSIFTLALTLGLSGTATAAQPGGSGVTKSYEQLEGFVGVVVKQINKVMGTDRLPAANGFPVEPGLYLTLGSSQMTIFDRLGANVAGGVPQDTTVATECKSGCSRAFYDALRRTWLDLKNESVAIDDEMPNRVLIAAEATLPARSFVDLAYAAAEARPGTVPTMYMLLNAGPGGLRARNFFLVPPGGLKLSRGTSALGFKIIVKGGGSYELGSADGRTIGKQEISGREALDQVLSGIDRKFPSKDAVVLEVAGNATVGDLLEAMVVAESRFPLQVLSMGDRLVM